MSLPTVLGILINVYTQFKRLGVPYRTPIGDDSWHEAVNKVWNAIKLSDPAIVAVQGPPGTGKTSVYVEEFYRVLENPAEFSNDVLVYIAPTNQLVLQTFARFAYALMSRMGDVRSAFEYITSNVYIYGSKVSVYNRSDLEDLKKVGLGIELELDAERNDLLNKLMRVKDVIRKPSERRAVEGPIFVFTTEWQQMTLEVSNATIKLLVDEASRSPIHRPFITTAKTILTKALRNEQFYITSFSVVGDPEQAIALEPEYRDRGYLIMNAVKKFLEEQKLTDKAFAFLEFTKRLPHPTEEPISKAFYDGRLKSRKDAREALGVFSYEDVRKACKKIVTAKSDRYVKQLCSLVESAVTTQIPMGIVAAPTFPAGETFEPKRVKASAILAAIFALANENLEIAVTGPYIDTVLNAEAYYRRLIESIKPPSLGAKVTFSTVHSMLGDEADIVISLLGKEWTSADDDSYTTIYFDEPELLNVQFSRHRRLILIVGDIETLRRSAAKLDQELGRQLRRESDLSRVSKQKRLKLERSKKIRVLSDEIQKLSKGIGAPQIKISG